MGLISMALKIESLSLEYAPMSLTHSLIRYLRQRAPCEGLCPQRRTLLTACHPSQG
jgi:hypothetical protein